MLSVTAASFNVTAASFSVKPQLFKLSMHNASVIEQLQIITRRTFVCSMHSASVIEQLRIITRYIFVGAVHSAAVFGANPSVTRYITTVTPKLASICRNIHPSLGAYARDRVHRSSVARYKPSTLPTA
ncbi:hypothetical protein ACQ4N7_10260 [Nodosilinea sp. AN01ver1]